VELPDEALASYLTSCLKRTKKGRRRRRRRVLSAQALGAEAPARGPAGGKEAEAADGVYSAYKRLAGALGARLSPESTPGLFQYLESPAEH